METETALAQDRLEIVLRNEQDDQEERKSNAIIDALIVLALSGSIIHSLINGSSKVAIGSGVLLTGYVLTRIWMMKNEWHRKVIRRITFLEDGLLLSSTVKDIRLRNEEIKHVHFVEVLTHTPPNSLTINLITHSGEIHNFAIAFTRAIKDGSLFRLLERLKAKPYFLEGVDALYPILQLRFPEAKLFDRSALEDLIGSERLTLLFRPEPGLDQARFHPTKTQVILFFSAALLFLFSTRFSKLSLFFFNMLIFFRPTVLFFDKPLQLVIGSHGVGIRSKGELVYGVPFEELQSMSFLPSRISPEKGLVKGSIVFLSGDKFEYDLKMLRPEDKAALAQITQEFKELKHGT